VSANAIKRHPIVTLGIILFVAVVALVVFRLSSGAKTDPRKNRILTVGTMTPIKQDLDVRLTYTADLIPNQLVNIFSRVDGYIAKIYVDKGDLVKANQLLVEIDHTDYIHAVNQAKANLLSAKAKVVQQDAGVRNATLTLDRMQALIKDQFVSQQDLDTALVNRDAAVALQDSLRAQVQQMTVALAQAETNLAYSYIRAPFSGYIAERNLDPGAEHHTHVNKGNAGADGRNYWDSWEAKAKTDPTAAAVIKRYHTRPAEELYDVTADPWETKNLAAEPAHAGRLAELRKDLDAWMAANGDEGLKTERALPDPQPKKNKD
jgi:pyruvate/2-oxoglutarate dehydrogenase complex dihydrolipoamide acyltransferase (E2) component